MKSFILSRAGMFVIALIVGGIAIACNGVISKVEMEKGVPDFNRMTMSDFKTVGFVQGNIYSIIDSYASRTTTNTSYGIKTSEYQSGEYFIMPLSVYEDDSYTDYDYKYITVFSSRADHVELLHAICDNTWAFFEDSSVTDFHEFYFTGKLEALDSDLRGWMTEYLVEGEWIEPGYTADSVIVPYVISFHRLEAWGTNIIIGAAALLLAAAITVFAIKKANAAKADMFGYTPDAPSDESGFA